MNNTLQNMNEECVSKIHNETNKRIYDRNIPSQMLQPYLDARPVMTKYSFLPVVDPRKHNSVNLQQMPTYNVHKVFNPGNTKSPYSGFATQVNVESELRNQIYALQKCSQSVYVPNSTSDLYNYNFDIKRKSQSHPLLFEDQSFSQFNPNPNKEMVGNNMFMNSTRCQVRDLTKQCN
jgi:hypothetical protein